MFHSIIKLLDHGLDNNCKVTAMTGSDVIPSVLQLSVLLESRVTRTKPHRQKKKAERIVNGCLTVERSGAFVEYHRLFGHSCAPSNIHVEGTGL